MGRAHKSPVRGAQNPAHTQQAPQPPNTSSGGNNQFGVNYFVQVAPADPAAGMGVGSSVGPSMGAVGNGGGGANARAKPGQPGNVQWPPFFAQVLLLNPQQVKVSFFQQLGGGAPQDVIIAGNLNLHIGGNKLTGQFPQNGPTGVNAIVQNYQNPIAGGEPWSINDNAFAIQTAQGGAVVGTQGVF